MKKTATFDKIGTMRKCAILVGQRYCGRPRGELRGQHLADLRNDARAPTGLADHEPKQCYLVVPLTTYVSFTAGPPSSEFFHTMRATDEATASREFF
jgi:hypothetical protein